MIAYHGVGLMMKISRAFLRVCHSTMDREDVECSKSRDIKYLTVREEEQPWDKIFSR